MDPVQSQIVRLDKALCCMGNQKTEAKIKLGNSDVGQEIEIIQKRVKELWNVIDDFKVTEFIDELKAISLKRQEKKKINGIIYEQRILIEKLNELNDKLNKSILDQKTISEQLVHIEKERSVWMHLIKSVNKNENIQNTDTLNQ